MNPLNIPALNGIKTVVAVYGQLIVGILIAATKLLELIVSCVNGTATLDMCFQNVPVLLIGLVVAFNGLGQAGIAHKVEKASAAQGAPISN